MCNQGDAVGSTWYETFSQWGDVTSRGRGTTSVRLHYIYGSWAEQIRVLVQARYHLLAETLRRKMVPVLRQTMGFQLWRYPFPKSTSRQRSVRASYEITRVCMGGSWPLERQCSKGAGSPPCYTRLYPGTDLLHSLHKWCPSLDDTQMVDQCAKAGLVFYDEHGQSQAHFHPGVPLHQEAEMNATKSPIMLSATQQMPVVIMCHRFANTGYGWTDTQRARYNERPRCIPGTTRDIFSTHLTTWSTKGVTLTAFFVKLGTF